jgi:hypothetical protein
MSDEFNPGNEFLLASAAEIAPLLAPWAVAGQRSSTHDYRDGRLAQRALANFFTDERQPARQPELPPVTGPVAMPTIPSESSAGSAENRSAHRKQQAPVVMNSPEPACPKYLKRERLRAEVLALLRSQPVMRTGHQSGTPEERVA